jgi:type IV secretory pathway VirB2 component (pilin)
MLFVPIVAVVSLIILAVLWGLRVIHFRTLAQWAGGVLLVGCASQLVNMLLS